MNARLALAAVALVWMALPEMSFATRVAYIYGDVAANGKVPSGSAEPFHQMLLDDEGPRGMSEFRDLIAKEGMQVESFYDRSTRLDAAFLNRFDIILFGLHQKSWSEQERAALDRWLRDGGGAIFYSDSAAGGLWSEVGLDNPVGQKAVNSVIKKYGMQVTVDLGGGTRSYSAPAENAHPIVAGPLVLEGEGVSPVAVDPRSDAEVLIALGEENRASGGSLKMNTSGISIRNPEWAALALAPVGKGSLLVFFDRQPFWNAGEGSDITKRDNREILRRSMLFLAGRGAELEAAPGEDSR